MDEMIDVLDENTGEKTGEVISKDEAHRVGKWHGSIHVLIVNTAKNKTLLQKRSSLKKLYPNMWDIAVGGHISSGESDHISAQRELEEEIGIHFDTTQMKKIDRVTEKFVNNGVISNEYVSIFLVIVDIDIQDIKLQEEEVSEVKWCTKQELNQLIAANRILPHHREYEILNEILKDSI